MHSNAQAQPKSTPPPPVLLITPGVDLTLHLDTCPAAQLLSGYLGDPPREHIIPLPCKQWSCRFCAQKKIRRLACKTRDAQPNRLLTLTVDPKLYADPRAAFDATRTRLPKLIELLRKRFGQIEYLRITELTNSGWPHYHMLIRSQYLPQPVVKKLWNSLTQALIVDVRQVPKTWSAVSYLTKYLTKLHRIEWTERHVSYSRGFFPPEEPNDNPAPSLNGPTIIHKTPQNYLRQTALNQYLVRVAPNLYRIDSTPPSPEDLDSCPPSSPKPATEKPEPATPNATTPHLDPDAPASAEDETTE